MSVLEKVIAAVRSSVESLMLRGHEELSPPRIPVATYRLQFNASFRFADAMHLVPYLHALGITDLYASPIFQARQGSTHGYDVTDHTVLNPELGTAEDFAALTDALRRHDMGLILDVVPNHMGIVEESNRWWQDVLENGPSSPYAKFFDIDWHPPKQDLDNKVLLPILGDQYGRVLENGEIRLVYDEDGFWVVYGQQRFPVAPRTWTVVLDAVLERLRPQRASDHPQVIELESIIRSLRHLPLRTETDPDKVRERYREKDVVKRRLATLVGADAIAKQSLEAVVAQLNGRSGDPHSFDGLEALLADQAYRLCYWRVAMDEINYRRFFDINDMAAIHVEHPEVFEAVHALVLRLVREGRATGLRIDHPDGLLDPEQYFLTLQAHCASPAADAPAVTTAPARPGRAPRRACYVVIEKILCRDERLRQTWAVHGTVGYECLNLINGLFVDPAGERPLAMLYTSFTGRPWRFADLVYDSKELILSVSMSSELHVLARRLDRISEQHRWSRDFTLASLQEALRQVIACFPVYRTYLRPGTDQVSDEDRRHIMAAIRAAKRRNPATTASLFDFIGSVLLRQDPDGLSEAERAERREFVLRFQQITGPVMAKGMEDTAFYRAYPLASLNEVGGDPERFGVSVETFHQAMLERAQRWPAALSASSTHDTKRSEDVRARLNVLSELPEEWADAVGRWRAMNRDKKTVLDGAEVPDLNEEYLFYQTLIGIWPLEPMGDDAYAALVQRVERYMEKALKEAKIHTSWVNPYEAYDQAVGEFVRRALARTPANLFVEDVVRVQERTAYVGMINALAQTLVKLTAPGVPDCYQGTELWNFSLVDPDNRRPVDFAPYRAMLEHPPHEPSAGHAQQLLASWKDGRIKLLLLSRALHWRRRHASLFLEGAYLPLAAHGQHREHVCAYARRHEAQWLIVAAPRLMANMVQPDHPPVGQNVWADTALRLPGEAPTRWRHVITGEEVALGTDGDARIAPLAKLFEHMPVALLEVLPDERDVAI